jgi:DNA-binding transcriptional regulator YdaS (Cro superfamily)
MTARKQLAEDCGTSPAYLWQVANGWRGRRASMALAKAIETATQGAVTCRDLRPDVFHIIES